mgnify:CR=1 FL=1
MKYYLTKTVDLPFKEAKVKVIEELKKQGFGVLTEIDVKATLKKKIDVDFRDYVILGACNPPFAHKALQAERHIGIMLPCNVIVQEGEKSGTEISIVDPVAAMGPIDNEALSAIAPQVGKMLAQVLDNI